MLPLQPTHYAPMHACCLGSTYVHVTTFGRLDTQHYINSFPLRRCAHAVPRCLRGRAPRTACAVAQHGGMPATAQQDSLGPAPRPPVRAAHCTGGARAKLALV